MQHEDDALTAAELATITGRSTLRQQVAALVRMGVPFPRRKACRFESGPGHQSEMR